MKVQVNNIKTIWVFLAIGMTLLSCDSTSSRTDALQGRWRNELFSTDNYYMWEIYLFSHDTLRISRTIGSSTKTQVFKYSVDDTEIVVKPIEYDEDFQPNFESLLILSMNDSSATLIRTWSKGEFAILRKIVDTR